MGLPLSTSAHRAGVPLLAAICHDLRAPLASVTMGANFVLQSAQRDEANGRSVKILEAMLRSCTQMERLIRNFADLSEIESNGVVLRLGPHDAGEILALTAESFRELGLSHSVTLEVIPPAQPITVRCDRERIARALGHIVENALHYAPASSKVMLSVKLHDGTVSFAVVDRGPGLSPEQKEHLYDRRWHAQRASRPGAGLGLAVAHGFVEAHEGRLEVKSRPGEPTTFTLVIPKDGPQPESGRRAVGLVGDPVQLELLS